MAREISPIEEGKKIYKLFVQKNSRPLEKHDNKKLECNKCGQQYPCTRSYHHGNMHLYEYMNPLSMELYQNEHKVNKNRLFDTNIIGLVDKFYGERKYCYTNFIDGKPVIFRFTSEKVLGVKKVIGGHLFFTQNYIVDASVKFKVIRITPEIFRKIFEKYDSSSDMWENIFNVIRHLYL